MSDMLIKMPKVYEPLKVNRFILRFPSDLGIQEWTVQSAKRPNAEQSVQEIKFLNTNTYVIGQYKWNAIEVTFRDPIGPSTTQAVMEWWRLHSESATGRQGYAAGYKRNVELEMLDPTGAIVQKWILVNCLLNSVDFGDLKYDGDELATVTVKIQMDYCILAY